MNIKINTKKVKITETSVGDYIKSFNIDTNQIEYNEILHLHYPIVDIDRQIKLIFDNGQSIITSKSHPMCYFNNGNWEYKETGLLKVGDICKFENGSGSIINILVDEEVNNDINFFDLTVDKVNNYFSGDNIDNLVLTHNSSTVHFPFWHKEIEDILVLKNNKGTDDNRVRHMDYSIQMNRLIYRRIVKNENISLFSPHDVPDMYDAFFKSNDLFEELYEKYEKDLTINKKIIKATDFINLLAQERIGTGRVYIMNIDHANTHSSFIDPIKMSNLCVAPETQILTSSGYQTISELEGETIEVWNGKEWSETKVLKTGENQKLIKINIKYNTFDNNDNIIDNDIVVISATEYHKWYDINNIELRTVDLYDGLELKKSLLPEGGYRTFEILSIEDNNRYDDTYCVNEPKEHKVVFNGVLTGNCQEILLPTTPLQHLDDDDSTDSEIALCVLAAINLGAIKELSEFEKIMDISVRVLDFIIENQDYPVKAAMKMLKRRSLGIGITNFAYWLAKNNVNYDTPEALPLVDELMEYIQYYGIKASVNLAKEYGAADYFNRTKYSHGILPIDTYNKNIDTIVNRNYSLDWEGLRKDILEYGMRNSTITALMPCESCVTKDTKIKTREGILSYEEILKVKNIDTDKIESDGEQVWIEFETPLYVETMNGIQESNRVFYNGQKEIYEIEFEDGNTYKMTGNHKLLVNRNNEQVWVRVDELNLDDDIVNIL
jgi:ribonucleotide reductase alpha subunit